jgi:hypothetical protein
MNNLKRVSDSNEMKQIQPGKGDIPPEITIIQHSGSEGNGKEGAHDTRAQSAMYSQMKANPASVVASDIPKSIDIFIPDPNSSLSPDSKVAESEVGLRQESSNFPRTKNIPDTTNNIKINNSNTSPSKARIHQTPGTPQPQDPQAIPTMVAPGNERNHRHAGDVVTGLPTTTKIDMKRSNSSHARDSIQNREREKKSLPAMSPHSCSSDLFNKAAQSVEDNQALKAASSLDGPSKNVPSKPGSIKNRRRTTGETSTQQRMEYYSSLNQNPNPPANLPNWNPESSRTASVSPSKRSNQSPARPLSEQRPQSASAASLVSMVSNHHSRNSSGIPFYMSEMQQSSNSNIATPGSQTFVNPFEDPSIIGELKHSIPLTQARSFPDRDHPLHNSRVVPKVDMTKDAITKSMPTSPLTPVTTQMSPSHPHSQFDPLLNANQPRPVTAPISTASAQHQQSLTLDSAALADIAAALSELKPQNKEAQAEQMKDTKKIPMLKLGTNSSDASGKKNHRRFLSHQFSRKGNLEFDSTEDAAHRRSNSTGNSNTAERPTTPGRKKFGVRLKKDKHAARPSLEVIASASGDEVEIKLRSSEQDPSRHQITIPSVFDLLLPSKLCELFEEYRNVDQNFDFSTLVGMSRVEMQEFVRLQTKASLAVPSLPGRSNSIGAPVSSQPVSSLSRAASTTDKVIMQSQISQSKGNDDLTTFEVKSQQQLMKAHVPILSSLLAAGDDLVVEGFYHETAHEKSTRDRIEVTIIKNDAQRQFLVVYQGCAEDQLKPVKKGEHKDGVDRRFNLGRKDDAKNVFSEDQPLIIFPAFRRAYLWDIEEKVFAKLDELVEENPFFDVVMTGHSFGGVLSQLGAMRYANIRPAIMISCFAYGCPKIGTTDFRYYVNSLPNLRVSDFKKR